MVNSDGNDFIPQFKPRIPGKLNSKNWLDFDEPQIHLFQGMRGSGKGGMVDSTAEKLYNHGFLILHIWGARSFENLYWAINKNCRSKYAKIKIIIDSFFEKNHFGGIQSKCASKGLFGKEYQKFLEIVLEQKLIQKIDDGKFNLTQLGMDFHNNKLLHCNCHKAYPVLWIVPDYVEFDQESLDRFNGVYWKDIAEYKKYFLEISSEDKQKLLEGKLLKPESVRPKPLIKICQITTPTSTQRAEKFREEFTKIVLDARDEHRVVVMNPAIFEGSKDKFDTVTEIFRMIPYLMKKSGHFKPLTEKEVGKSRKYWNKWQKSYHKVVIVINELRSVAPSSRMHGEKFASSSKKAIFDFIPEARHFSIWVLGDYQDHEDLYGGVKKQANNVHIKRGSRNILGDDYKWLFDKVERDRLNLGRKIYKRNYLEKIGHLRALERKYPKLQRYLDQRRPYVDNLPDNKVYVTWPNQEFRLETVDLPSFHHKTSLEDFMLDTGLTWTVNDKKKPVETKALSKSEQKQVSKVNKKIRDENMKKIQHMKEVENKSWIQIKEKMVSLENAGLIPQMGYENQTPKNLSNAFGKWKLKQEQD